MKKMCTSLVFLFAMLFTTIAGADISPATLNMSMWSQAGNYTCNSSPVHWTGTASQGASGTTYLGPGWSDPLCDSLSYYNGESLNGHAAVEFDGYQSLISSANLDDLITTTGWSTFALVKSYDESSGVDPSIGYVGIPVMEGFAYNWGVMVGLVWQQVSGYNDYGAQTGFTANAWQFIQAYYDGTDVCARVNSDSWTCGASANWLSDSSPLSVGMDSEAFSAFNGLMEDLGVAPVVFSQSTFNGIKGYMNTRYGLSL